MSWLSRRHKIAGGMRNQETGNKKINVQMIITLGNHKDGMIHCKDYKINDQKSPKQQLVLSIQVVQAHSTQLLPAPPNRKQGRTIGLSFYTKWNNSLLSTWFSQLSPGRAWMCELLEFLKSWTPTSALTLILPTQSTACSLQQYNTSWNSIGLY